MWKLLEAAFRFFLFKGGVEGGYVHHLDVYSFFKVNLYIVTVSDIN